MGRKELRQQLDVCVSTLRNLNGYEPSVTELYSALGSEYKDVISEYLDEKDPLAIVA